MMHMKTQNGARCAVRSRSCGVFIVCFWCFWVCFSGYIYLEIPLHFRTFVMCLKRRWEQRTRVEKASVFDSLLRNQNSLSGDAENATRRLGEDDARTLPTLHVEMANSTRGVFNISKTHPQPLP